MSIKMDLMEKWIKLKKFDEMKNKNKMEIKMLQLQYVKIILIKFKFISHLFIWKGNYRETNEREGNYLLSNFTWLSKRENNLRAFNKKRKLFLSTKRKGKTYTINIVSFN